MQALTDVDITAARQASTIRFISRDRGGSIVCEGVRVPADVFGPALAFYGDNTPAPHTIAVASRTPVGQPDPAAVEVARADTDPAWQTIAHLLEPGDQLLLHSTNGHGGETLRLVVHRAGAAPTTKVFVLATRPAPAALVDPTPPPAAVTSAAPSPAKAGRPAAKVPDRTRPKRHWAVLVGVAVIGAFVAVRIGIPVIYGAGLAVGAVRTFDWVRVHPGPLHPARRFRSVLARLAAEPAS